MHRCVSCRNVGAPEAAAGGSRKGRGASAASAAQKHPSMVKCREQNASLEEMERILISAETRIILGWVDSEV